MNLKEPGSSQAYNRSSKYSANSRTKASNSYTNSEKAHRSPVPIVKSSPLTNKDNKSFENNIELSTSDLIKLKSTGMEYGDSAKPKKNGTLQKFHLEK